MSGNIRRNEMGKRDFIHQSMERESPAETVEEIAGEALSQNPIHRVVEEACIVVDSDEEDATQDVDLEWKKVKETRRAREKSLQRVEKPILEPMHRVENPKADLEQLYGKEFLPQVGRGKKEFVVQESSSPGGRSLF